ncbi:MAG: toll/interleukin-1 receptor domain-containing protein [Gammaproteobacteria bacterium]|nr:toll/interleukin-1 receptor domain-containing protein [Gammaproteobacteria bacterium]
MTNVFISYSHQDEDWKDRVVRQLAVLATEGMDVWNDRQIGAGDDWRDGIEQAIARCDVAVLLISAHFLTSPFILDREIPPLLQRRQGQGIRIVPLILSPSQWTRVPWLKAIQARPKDGKPLSGMSDHGAEAALSTLAGEIADLLLPRPSKSVEIPIKAKGPPPPAANLWAEKLDYLRRQEAICSDPAQRFTLNKQIEEAETKLRAL